MGRGRRGNSLLTSLHQLAMLADPPSDQVGTVVEAGGGAWRGNEVEYLTGLAMVVPGGGCGIISSGGRQKHFA